MLQLVPANHDVKKVYMYNKANYNGIINVLDSSTSSNYSPSNRGKIRNLARYLTEDANSLLINFTISPCGDAYFF